MAGDEEYAKALAFTNCDDPWPIRLIQAGRFLSHRYELWNRIVVCAELDEPKSYARGRGDEYKAALQRVQDEIAAEADILLSAPVKQGHPLDDDKTTRRESER